MGNIMLCAYPLNKREKQSLQIVFYILYSKILFILLFGSTAGNETKIII